MTRVYALICSHYCLHYWANNSEIVHRGEGIVLHGQTEHVCTWVVLFYSMLFNASNTADSLVSEVFNIRTVSSRETSL